MDFNLAPLQMRRDIAMLGVLHRAALGEGPPQLRVFFRRRPGNCRLEDAYNGAALHPLVKRSAWGLVAVYNRLGSGAHTIATTKEFQGYLQERVKSPIRKGYLEGWDCSYSPRRGHSFLHNLCPPMRVCARMRADALSLLSLSLASLVEKQKKTKEQSYISSCR